MKNATAFLLFSTIAIAILGFIAGYRSGATISPTLDHGKEAPYEHTRAALMLPALSDRAKALTAIFDEIDRTDLPPWDRSS